MSGNIGANPLFLTKTPSNEDVCELFTHDISEVLKDITMRIEK